MSFTCLYGCAEYYNNPKALTQTDFEQIDIHNTIAAEDLKLAFSVGNTEVAWKEWIMNT